MRGLALRQSFQGTCLENNSSCILCGPWTLQCHSVTRGLLPIAVRCSYNEGFQILEQTSNPFAPSELRLPLENQSSEANVSSEEVTAADSLPASMDPIEASTKDKTLADTLSAATEALEGLTVSQLAIYGGLTVAGLFILDSILNSLELLPLFTEVMQTIGVLYAILLVSRIFQGKPLSFTPSPVKTIIELVERGDTRRQRASLWLPQDLDARVLATMEKLAKERDDAVNEMEDLRRKAGNYVRIVAEKEALEAVAMQLAQERDKAMSEVTALKQAVDAMSDRMRSVEKMLQQELKPLRQSTRALETVALQLASERDSALKELSKLKEVVAVARCREEETVALESLATQLAEERDKALSENGNLQKILENLQTARAPVAGLNPEQENFFKACIGAAGLQYIDLNKQYDDQKEKVDEFVSHLVEQYGAPPGWTAEYVKHFLDSPTSRKKTVAEVP